MTGISYRGVWVILSSLMTRLPTGIGLPKNRGSLKTYPLSLKSGRYPKSYACENKECDFVIWKNICGKSLSSAQAVKLLTKGKTDTLKGLKSKSGKSFDAAIKLNSNYKTEFVFSSSSSKSKKSYRK